MSRATDLRDAVATEMAFRFPTERVETVIYPDHTREELAEMLRIIVRKAGRSPSVEQGPDVRTVDIEVGVIAALSPLAAGAGRTKDDYRDQRLQESDAADTLVEQIVALFTPNGVLSHGGFGDYSFESLDEATTLDVRALYERDVHLSIVTLTFLDSVDDST